MNRPGKNYSTPEKARVGEMIVAKKRSLDAQLFGRLFGAFPVALAVIDRDLLIQYSNETFSKVFGLEGAALSLAVTKFLPFGEVENLVGCASSERKSKEAELQLGSPPGGSAFFRTTVIPFALKGDLGSLFLVTLEDVSERVRLEEQLLQAEKLSAMGQMAASIAHELGNPLSVMITSLEYLRHAIPRSTRGLQEQIEIMEENAKRMHELLTSLADMSGLRRFQPEKEDIRKAVIPVLFFVGRMAEKSKVTVKSDLSSELPPCRIDLRQLKQVFLNLLKNAIESMPKGGTITVRTRCRCNLLLRADMQTGSFSEGSGFVIVEIEDTGKGIPPSDLETIFRPFHSTKKRGMGLGLSLCRGIIENHGGTMWATSQKGKGSCFIVEIPADCGL